MKSPETLTALGNNMLVLWKVTLLIWRSYQIAQDHRSIPKLSVNVGYCKRTVREYCSKKRQVGREGSSCSAACVSRAQTSLPVLQAASFTVPASGTFFTCPFLQLHVFTCYSKDGRRKACFSV